MFKDQDKDKDCIVKDKDQDKDCILVLKESLMTRTRTNITGINKINFTLSDAYSHQLTSCNDRTGLTTVCDVTNKLKKGKVEILGKARFGNPICFQS